MILRKYLSQEEIQNVFDEFEFSQSLLEPQEFKVIPIRVSLRRKDKRFSGLIVKYKGVIGFIPLNGLKTFCYELEAAEKLVRERVLLNVYFANFEEKENLFAPEQWKTPIFTMFEPK